MNELIAFFAGTALGLAGLLPFLHTNTLLQLFPQFFQDALAAGIFAVALAFSHAVFEVIPATFFAVPSATQTVSVLPAQRMAREGQGFKALKTMVYALAAGAFIAVLAAPAAALLLPPAYSLLKPVTAIALVAVLALVLFSERKNLAVALLVVALSGALGLVSLNLPIAEPIFPLLTGLFAIPAVLIGMRSKKLAQQKEGEARMQWGMVALGSLLGACSGLLPAMSPALLAAVAFIFLESSSEKFIALASSIAGAKLVSDVIVLGVLGKARSGAAAAVENFLGTPNGLETALLLVAGLAALAAGLAILLLAYRGIARFLCGRDYSLFSKLFLAMLLVMVFAFGGWLALFVAAIAACVGLVPVLLGSRRSYCCAALIVPAIAFLI